MAEQRTKEIGVRKVLGASVFSLWKLLSRDFVALVVMAAVIAAPIAYYFANNWLGRYDYKVEISWTVFAACGLGAVVITILTVSYQSIKAVAANPVESLKSE
jgi:ABC-type antimicrobial peptide transport system permease subunit